MKVLGIDYGSQRIGLAISDESKILARELSIIAKKDFYKEIKTIVTENAIGEIVIGLPLNMSGQDTDKTKEVRAFSNKLTQELKLPVELMDERLSTEMTKHLPGGNRNKDSLAAQIILQNYLDKNKTLN